VETRTLDNYVQFNQDTVRDNFTAISLLLNTCLDSVNNGAVFNQSIDEDPIITEGLSRGCRSDLLDDAAWRAKG
jgi:hypothetical protein